jgi:hypothetical protein
VLLWTRPKLRLAPFAELTQLLHFCVMMLDVVFDRQTGRVEHPDLAAKVVKDA